MKIIMTVFIRSARSQDQTTIKALVRGSHLNPINVHWQNFIVAVDSDVIAGVAQIRPHWDGSRELASVAVDPAYQAQGIGRTLVQTLLCCSDETLYLFCADNMADYYRPFGFVSIVGPQLPTAMRPMYYLGCAITRLVAIFSPDSARITAMRLVRTHPQMLT